jgi:uncharacterized membrane protein YuzA (DUF378 family)
MERTDSAEDYRLLLTVIAAIALGVAATAMPVLIAGPFGSWTYAARLVMWLTGIAAVILEYLAVSFGSRLYLRRVEVFATTSLALVFLAQAGMFAVVGMDASRLGSRWFVLFALFNLFAAVEAEHGRRVVVRHAHEAFDADVVHTFVTSLRRTVWFLAAVGACSLLLAILWNDAPPGAVFVASCLAFAAMVAANLHEHRTRSQL